MKGEYNEMSEMTLKEQLVEVIGTLTPEELIWMLSEMHKREPFDQEGLGIAKAVIDGAKNKQLKLD